MATGSDLINLSNLVLTDTFNTWFNRSNEIIDSLNPLQVYDVQVGTTGGLLRQTGEVASNYNGVVTISVNPGPGIGTRSVSGNNMTVVDFALFDDFGLVLTGGGATTALNRVATDDEYIINDLSVGGEGTAKKVQARYMLPPTVDVGSLVINGNLTVNGNLSTFGSQDYLATNNLRIEDLQIELAYQESIPLNMTGVGATSFSLGATAYYFPTVSGVTASFYGHVQSFTSNSVGHTGILSIGAMFQDPYGPRDFGPTGYVSMQSTGPVRFFYGSTGSITSNFLSDINLNNAGINVRGASGDKTLLWQNTDADTGAAYYGWISNTNLGVDNSTSSIISRVYRSFGYTGINQSQFIFAAEAGQNTEVFLTQANNTLAPLTFTAGAWKITKTSGATGNDLIFSIGTTGINSLTESFRITPGPSGQTFAGITTNNWAKMLNVDMLDGAHAHTASSAYTIPIADSNGQISDVWISPTSIRRKYTITGHGFTAGHIVRITTTGAMALAYADNAANAESIGVVSTIHDANNLTVTYKGRITGLSGSQMTVEGVPFVAGSVYFLTATGSSGLMIGDPDYATATRLCAGQVRKPLLLAVSQTEGLVLNEIGVKLVTPTDEVYLPGLVPVGSISPYAGSLSYLSEEWLLCDGDCYRALDYPELYQVIGRTFHAKITFASSGTTGTVIGGLRGLAAGYVVNIAGSNRTILSVNSTTGTITVDSIVTAATWNFTAITNVAGENIFFVPDLRTRFPLGGSTGDSEYTSIGLTAYSLATIAGSEMLTISNNQLPVHAHGLSASAALFAAGSISALTNISNGSQFNSGITGGGAAIDVHSPYLVTHYIIRAKNSTSATIITGHDHDNRYVRYDSLTQSNFGGSAGTTAASYRSKIGVYGVDDVYSRTQTDARYYGTAASDSRYINAGGDTNITGSYQSTGVVQMYNSGGHFEVQGNYHLYLPESGSSLTHGFEIAARNSAVANGAISGRYPIYQAFGNPSPASYDSRVQNWMYGDMLLYGPDGLSSGSFSGHTELTFAVNSLVNLTTLRGGYVTDNGATTRPPTLQFVNSAYSTTTPVGVIAGLTAPTAFHHAVNKEYVDNKANDSFTLVPTLAGDGSTLDGAYVQSPVRPGKWMITCYGTTDADYGSGFVVRLFANCNDAQTSLEIGELTISENTDIALPFSITTLVNCDLGDITFTFGTDPVSGFADFIYRVEKIIGVRIGDVS